MHNGYILGLVTLALAAGMAVSRTPLVLSESVQASSKIPVCMIIDDAGPFTNAGTAIYPGEVSETPTSFYAEFGHWRRQTA